MNKSLYRSFLLFVFIGLVALAAMVSFITGFVVAVDQIDSNDSSLAANTNNVFQKSWEIIHNEFYGELPTPRQRAYGSIRGMLDTLGDSYTVLIEPAPRQLERDDLRGSYGGIGAVLNQTSDGQIVLSPFRDSPAAQVGILEGDILVAVDGLRLTPDMNLTNDIVTRIRGEVGTDVILTIQRQDEPDELDFVVMRQVIKTPSVTWKTLNQDTPTLLGYVQVRVFTGRTSEEMAEGLQELLDDGVQGIILDLRDNGGGLLQAAIDVSSHFLDDDAVLYEDRRGQEEKFYPASQGGIALDVPLVVLVNHNTASASEIVAGAIQDRQRGILIGETTFGKGSVQLIYDLSDGSSLHITAAEWLTPDRHRLQGVGLTPNLLVSPDPENPDADLQLERAITFLLDQE